jgi:hypothetical protein
MKPEEILIRITDAQFVAFKRLAARHNELPTDLYFDGYSALMCNAQGLIIGIEQDGYAHS